MKMLSKILRIVIYSVNRRFHEGFFLSKLEIILILYIHSGPENLK